MSHIVRPENQDTFIDPYSSYLFDMGVEDSRVYLSRQINSLLRAFGEDCVVAGLYTSADLSNNIIRVTIQPGKAVVDTTLHIFPEPTLLDLDLSPYDPSGYVVVSIAYMYIQTMYNNKPYFKLTYVSSDGSSQSPEPWSPNRDRLILSIYKFEKDESNNVINLQYYFGSIFINSICYFPRYGKCDSLTSYNLVFDKYPELNGGTFFDDTSNYALFDAGTF